MENIKPFEEFEVNICERYNHPSPIKDSRYLELYNELHKDKINNIYEKYRREYTRMLEFILKHPIEDLYIIRGTYRQYLYIDTWRDGDFESATIRFDGELTYHAIRRLPNKNHILKYLHNIYLENIDKDYDKQNIVKEARKYSHY